MSKMIAATGNEAIANAMRLANPDVCSAYPITPATEIMHIFSGYAANGEVSTEMLLAESEHSAMSACIGAAAAEWTRRYGYIFPGAGPDVGAALHRLRHAPAHCHGSLQPSPSRSHQYRLRPPRQHGRP